MQYLEIISKEYLPKLFYFSLGKTGSEQAAEELVSDIYYQILLSLKRGNVPHNLSAWVWKIARNCYAKWADNKRLGFMRNQEDDFNPDEYPDGIDMENDMILSEELKIMRRELALIRKEYREIIVSHYFENKSVSNIAQQLNVPVGTVKTRLQNGRKKLKEGMNMTREFGSRSYNPEEVHFVLTDGMDKNNQLSQLLGRKIPKNILLEAYRNPSTIEELSLELGIASVYMEEEAELLKRGELLEYLNGRYYTNFCIISRQAQEDIYGYLEQSIHKMTLLLVEYIDMRSKYFDENKIKWHYGFQAYDEMKWSLILDMADKMWMQALEDCGILRDKEHIVHVDGSDWILTGYEEYKGKKPEFISLEGCLEEETKAYSDRVHMKRYFMSHGSPATRKSPMINQQCADELKKTVAAEEGKYYENYLRILSDYGYIRNGRPDITVLTEEYEQADKDSGLLGRMKEVQDCFTEFMQYLVYRIKEDIPVHLKNNSIQITNALNGFIVRGAVIEEALRTGYISDNEDSSMLGVLLVI